MASLKNKKGDIEITLFETKGIKSGDIFVIIDLPPNKTFKTHLFKGPDPKIFEKFVLDLMTFQDDEVTLTVKEQKTGGSKFIGQIQIPIKALNLPQGPQWYYLTDRPLKEGQKPKIVTGSLQIQFTFIHRLIRAKSRSSIPREFFEPPAPLTSQNDSQPTSQSQPTQQWKPSTISGISNGSNKSYNNNTSSSSGGSSSNNNNYLTVSSTTSCSTTSSSSSSPNSITPEHNINYGYPVSISVGGNNSGSDILETQRGESINSRYMVPLIPIDDNENHGSITSSNNNNNSSKNITNNSLNEYTKEEDLIIEETIKDKESIVKKQIQIQKDLILKLNETIKQLEKQGKPVISEKVKLKKMQEDIDDMERLIVPQPQQPTTIKKSTVVVSTATPLQKVPSKGKNLMTKTVGNNKSNEKLQSISTSPSSTSPPTSSFLPSSSSSSPSSSSYNNNNNSMNLIHASIFNNNNIMSSSHDVESKMKIFIVELENERRSKESALEDVNLLEREVLNLKRELASTKSNTQVKSYDELWYRFKILEAENQSLIQEKEILNEKYKLFEKESEKLEKELEYEQQLKRKETEKKEFEREESKKLIKELEQAQTKEKLLIMELDTQKELSDVMREKKILLERETSKLEQELKQLKQQQQQSTITGIVPNTVKSIHSIEQLQLKVKQLESEIDLEKKSRILVQEKLKLAERDQKLIDRLESEVKRLESQIKSLTNTNEAIERERNRAVQSRDQIQKEKDQLEKEISSGSNLKNTLTNGTPKQIEEKLNEMVGILVNISQKPDSAASASIANNKLFDTPLGKKIKDISEKIQTATLKNKEMELNLVELNNSKIKTQLDLQSSLLQQSSLSSNELNSSTSSLNRSNSNLNNNNNESNLIIQQQNEQISLLVTKLEKLDRLEEFIRKLDDMKQFQSINLLNSSTTNNNNNNNEQFKRTHLNMKLEMEEIQKIILNDKVGEKERNDANVKFEKLFQELSMTEEYRREIQMIQDEKRRLNEPLNMKSLSKMKPIYSIPPTQQSLEIRERIKDNPELSLIGMDPKAILSKHQNDFQSYLLSRSLTIDELRSIRASLPKFRTDQKKQMEWTLFLEEKIDQLSKQPPQTTQPIVKSKPKLLNITKLPQQPQKIKGKPDSPSNHQILLNELLKKRSKIN
ncbi:hypothetical protein ACTFIR_000241 [Dictyostelium discoideum]